jgi:soluble lytic murein transglycosylase-like protein
MYTRASLPTPVRLIPFTVLIIILFGGALVSQSMLGIELPPIVQAASNAVIESAHQAETALAPASDTAVQQSAALVVTSLSPVFTPEVQYWADDIVRWSNAYGVDANLVATVMQIESCGDPQAVSRSGAQGLFQVMPFHFDAGENMLDPETNAKRGVAYLAGGLTLSNNQPGLALAGYNGGHSQISKTWSLWPNETQRYYYWGSGIYGDIASGLQTSGRLTEWLNAGGASLCAQAHARLGMQ